MMGSGFLTARLAGTLVRPRGRARARLEIARRCHGLRTFEAEASDVEVWSRLGDELPEWVYSRVVGPVTVDRLNECLKKLDPTKSPASAETKAARIAMRSVLDGLYDVLISSFAITRGARDVRHTFRVRRQTRRGLGFAPWEVACLAAAEGVVVVLLILWA
jgi:hypothetical protein